MSYIGDPYKYDVFVSYPHAVEALRGQTNMREWSRKVVDDVLEYVTMSLIDEDGGENLNYYLDRDNAVTADPLTDTLEDAVQRSAVLVILMSPYYRKWCVKELEWFFAKAKDDGRGFRQCVLLEVQKTNDKVWPELLRDKAGERLFREQLMDDDGLPFGFEQFKSHGTLPDTGGRLKRLGIEIRDKLKEMRALREAERSLAAAKVSRFPAEGPMIYLETEPQDWTLWSSRRERLADKHAMVLPEELGDQGLAEMSESLLSDYKDCQGLVLHRTRLDDAIKPRIRRAYRNRNLLYQKEHTDLRWAVLDELPEIPLPSAEAFRVARISAKDDDWPDLLLAELSRGPADATASP